jgi:hypothetical protein
MKKPFLKIPSFDHVKLISKSIINKDNECWVWQGRVRPKGSPYGLFHIKGRAYQAHRASYDLFYGIKDLTNVIDHKCRNSRCINPEHLREVTATVNALENCSSPCAINATKTHCKNGHEFNEENTRAVGRIKKRRSCKICSRADYHKNKNLSKRNAKYAAKKAGK